MNLEEIKARARSFIIDVTSAVEGGLTRSIQLAQRELEKKCFCPDQLQNTTFQWSLSATTSGAYWIDFGSLNGINYDFIRLAQDPWLIDAPDSSVAYGEKKLTRLSGSRANEERVKAISALSAHPELRGSPKYWEQRNDLIYFYPIVDDNGPFTGGAYQVSVSFYKHQPPLANSTDTNWFSNDYESSEFMVFKATEDGLRLIRDPLFMTYRAMAQEMLIKATRAARRRGWNPDQFIDVQDSARLGSAV